jgi:hypothetical protein
MRIELSQSRRRVIPRDVRLARRPARRRPEPQLRPRLLARLDAGVDQDLQRLRLLERIDGVVADPNEFEAGLAPKRG